VHQVVSGAVLAGDAAVELTAVTEVEFKPHDAGRLEWYLGSGEWRERAGGYAIQGRGAALVEAVRGDYLNVVGLPVAALLDAAPDLISSGIHG
jgi:septum formation protein